MKRNDILKNAFQQAAEKELNALPKEEDIIRSYSEKFNKKMNKLFDEAGQDKTVPVTKKKIRWAVPIAVVLMCVSVIGVSASEALSRLRGERGIAVVDYEFEDLYMTDNDEEVMREITYKGKEITFNYILETAEDFFWPDRGIMLFLNGVRQTFDARTAEGEYEDTDMLYLKAEAGAVNSVEITFKPNVGQKGEVLNLSVVSVFDPEVSFYPQCKGEHKQLFVGHWDDDNDGICDVCGVNLSEIPSGPASYTIHSSVPVRVIMAKDAEESTDIALDFSGAVKDDLADIIYKSYESENFNGDKWNDYDSTEILNMVLYKNLEDCYFYELGALCSTTRIETEADREDDFIINLHGKTGRYRISVYVNNELQNVFDGAAYTDVDVVHGQQVELNINLDTSVLPKGDNYCYIMCENLNDEINAYMGTRNSRVYTVEIK